MNITHSAWVGGARVARPSCEPPHVRSPRPIHSCSGITFTNCRLAS